MQLPVLFCVFMLQLAQQDSSEALLTITVNLMIKYLKVVPLAYFSLSAKIYSLSRSNQDLFFSVRIWFVLILAPYTLVICTFTNSHNALLKWILLFVSFFYPDVYLQALNVFILMVGGGCCGCFW